MVRFQDDFDNAVNEQWKKDNPIPDIYPRYTNFTVLHEKLEKLKMEICENEENTLINNLYNLYKNQNEESCYNLIKNYINEIKSKQTKKELINFLLYEIPKGKYLLFHVCHSGTERNPLFQIPQFSFNGLSLPDMSYYTERTELKEPLLELIKNQFEILSISHGDLEFIWNIESHISKYHYTRAERREPLKTYHPTTMNSLKRTMEPYFDELNKVFPEDYHDIVLNNDTIFYGLKEVVEDYSLEQLQMWFYWKVIKKYAGYTTHKLYENQFEFYSKKLNGINKPKTLEKRGAELMEDFLEDMFTKIYLENYVDSSLRENFTTFVEEIRNTLRNKMKNASWMCDDTKRQAIDKLDSMTLKTIGPTDYKDYSLFDKKYNNILEFVDDYYLWDWEVLEVKEKMYSLRDPKTWLMSAMTINAYYHPSYNEIVFPAGILQEPFYGVNQSMGENAGGIGAVIAHEMTHGFDDQGSRFDKNGYLYNWWSKETREKYETIIQKMETHFNSLTYEDKQVNGKLTQGENLADLGGLQTSLSLCKTEEDKRDCLLSWAKIWRANSKKEYSQQMLVIDPHSPPHLRINGILQHIQDFYKLFDVKEGDKMFLQQNKRCMLWSE